MRNQELQQTALDAEYQLRGAEASLNNMKAQLQNQLMDKRAQAAAIRSAYHTAALQKANNEKLFSLGLVADVIVKTSEVQAEELAKQNEIAEKQVRHSRIRLLRRSPFNRPTWTKSAQCTT